MMHHSDKHYYFNWRFVCINDGPYATWAFVTVCFNTL